MEAPKELKLDHPTTDSSDYVLTNRCEEMGQLLIEQVFEGAPHLPQSPPPSPISTPTNSAYEHGDDLR